MQVETSNNCAKQQNDIKVIANKLDSHQNGFNDKEVNSIRSQFLLTKEAYESVKEESKANYEKNQLEIKAINSRITVNDLVLKKKDYVSVSDSINESIIASRVEDLQKQVKNNYESSVTEDKKIQKTIENYSDYLKKVNNENKTNKKLMNEKIRSVESDIFTIRDEEESFRKLTNSKFSKIEEKMNNQTIKESSIFKEEKQNNAKNNKSFLNSKENAKPTLSSKNPCHSDNDGCCKFCEIKFNELESKGTALGSNFFKISEDVEAIQISFTDLTTKLESLNKSNNPDFNINELYDQLWNFKDSIQEIKDETLKMKKSKNIESRDYNDIKNTLEFISENINMANLLSEEDFKNVRDLQAMYNKLELLEDQLANQNEIQELKHQIEDLNLQMTSLIDAQSLKEISVEKTKKKVGRPATKKNLGSKKEGPLDDFIGNNLNNLEEKYNYQELNKKIEKVEEENKKSKEHQKKQDAKISELIRLNETLSKRLELIENEGKEFKNKTKKKSTRFEEKKNKQKKDESESDETSSTNSSEKDYDYETIDSKSNESSDASSEREKRKTKKKKKNLLQKKEIKLSKKLKKLPKNLV